MPAAPARKESGVAWMIAACVLFTGMALSVAAAHERDPELSTVVASVMRSGVNLVALVVLARGDLRLLFGDARAALWARGVFGGFSLLTYFLSLFRLGAGEAAFLNQTSAVWVAASAPWLLGERTSPVVWLAVLGSMVGVGFLGHPRDLAGDLVGRIAALASGFFAAGAYVSIRKAATSNGPLAIVFYFTLIALVASSLVAFALDVSWPRDPVVYAWLVGSGLTATVAQLWMTKAYRIGPAALVAAAGAASPLFTAIGGWGLLDQVPDAAAMVGMGILVVTGILLPIATSRVAR